MAKSRWHQDLAVHQLIEHLDQPDKRGALEKLTAAEVAAVIREIDLCRRDFVYAARNYFWISNKKLGDQLFTLWPSQEIILQKVLELKAKGLPQKIIIVKARQLGALDPDTPVLTADLRWVPISSVKPGDRLVATDEYPPRKRCGRKFRSATVLRKWSVEKEAFRLTFDNGKIIIATADHPFLCKNRGAVHTAWVTVKKTGSVKSRSPIVPGDCVRYVAGTWEQGTSFEDGWFAGLLDGEGSLRAKDNGGIEACVSQVAGPVLDRAAAYLSDRGYSYRVDVDTRKGGNTSKLGNQTVYKLVISRTADVFRLIGTTHPSRFAGREPWEDKKLPKGGDDPAWATVTSVESLGIREMVDIETTTKTFIANGFVTHNCSTLIEAMIAWRTMFFSNVNALVVSVDINHAAYSLWPIMQNIYDRIPWWLQGMCSMRKAEEGLMFDNPKHDERRHNPGLRSQIYVKGANSGGVGKGIRLSAAHISEFAHFDDDVAKFIIDEDMTNALVEDANTFCILESTAGGANRYAHRLWKRCVELEQDAEFFPLFLPWFFEQTRVRVITPEFHLDGEEIRMRDRVITEWVRCSNDKCRQYHNRFVKQVDRTGEQCPTCEDGTLHPYRLTDQQLHWIQHRRKNAKRDDESIKKLLQSMCSSGEEAFQISGIQVFGPKAQEFANSCVRQPIAVGDFDASGRFHGCNPAGTVVKGLHGEFRACFVQDCTLDHSFDSNPLQIWEWPIPSAEYVIGADVSEGGGADYSVAACIRNVGGMSPNYQVATWRSNQIEPYAFAAKIHHLGMFYNGALASVEINKFDTCLGALRFNLDYPNLYRWKHIDSVNIVSNKYGWETNQKSKPRLWQTFRAFLNQEIFLVRSRNAVEEMKNFIKEYADDISAAADEGEHDDEIMALQIALFCSTEGTYNEALGMAVPRQELTMETAAFHVECKSCGHKWPAMYVPGASGNMDEVFFPHVDGNKHVQEAGGMQCPVCHNRMLSVVRNTGLVVIKKTEGDYLIAERESGWSPEQAWRDWDARTPDYKLL